MFQGGNDIAIIGMDGIFPGAPDIRQYWQNITHKKDCITPAPKSWNGDQFLNTHVREYNRIYTTQGGFIDDIAHFNPLEYGVMPSVIEGNDPEHFLVIRVAQNSLKDAGYADKPFNRERTGVILGRAAITNRGNVANIQQGLLLDQMVGMVRDLFPQISEPELVKIESELKNSIPRMTAENCVGIVPNLASSRIANRLDLMGPNYNIDCACASSLLALDAAISELLRNRCDLMIVGGVQTTVSPLMFMVFCQLQALSRRASLRPFDKNADGTLLGEGIGMVVLKRRCDAERDGDRIYAIIQQIGSSSDGKASGILAPRPEGQALALKRAYEASGIPSLSVNLVEAHGTGTHVGDPIEINTIKTFFSDPSAGFPRCAVGSVKSMIGHTLTAAGIAGLIKCALSLHYKVLPPTLCDEPDPGLGLAQSEIYINSELKPWIQGGAQPRRSGINSFGFGGINSHAILEEARTQPETMDRSFIVWEDEVFLVCGQDINELREKLLLLKTYVQENPNERLLDIAFSLACEFSTKVPFKIALVAKDGNELSGKIDRALSKLGAAQIARINDRRGIYFEPYTEVLAASGKLAIVFPGEGCQYPNMLFELCNTFPQVRQCFDALDGVFEELNIRPLPSQILYTPFNAAPEIHAAAKQRMTDIQYKGSLILTANLAMMRIMELLEIRADCFAGHSLGDDSALFASGIHPDTAFAAQTAYLSEFIKNNRKVAGLIPKARLMSVGAVKREIVIKALALTENRVLITMDNCKNQVVLCGTESDIDLTFQFLVKQGGVCAILELDSGIHTPAAKPVCDELRKQSRSQRLRPPQKPVYSSMTAERYPDDAKEIQDIMIEQWAQPVRFRETVEKMYADGVRIFVEAGPRGNLTPFISDILTDRPHCAVASDDARRPGRSQLNHLVAQLAAQGVSFNVTALYQGRSPNKIDMKNKRQRENAGRVAQDKKTLLPLAIPYLSVKSSLSFQSPATGDCSIQQSNPSDARNQIMKEYLANMNRFIEVQKNIMQHYPTHKARK